MPTPFLVAVSMAMLAYSATTGGMACRCGWAPAAALSLARRTCPTFGVEGGATGSAIVTLSPIDAGAGTRLSYDVTASVTGKIAQLGSRLIESTSKKLAGQFFTAFVAHFADDNQE